MKQAKIHSMIVQPDQQLTLLTANAQAADRRVHAAEKKARLAKTKLKSARKAYKLAKKALKKIAKVTKQAHKELVKFQKHSAKKQNRPKAGVKVKHPSLNKRKRGPAPKPPTVVDQSPAVVVPVALPIEKPELPKAEPDGQTAPQADPTSAAPTTES